MKVQITFHGKLSVLTGIFQKYYFDVRSLNDLKFRIMDDFPGIIHVDHSIYINEKICSENTPVRNNDRISLIPYGND
jgi:hypothetical protein